ncbi:hypothetical protein IC575_027139 [Cucumis melo]
MADALAARSSIRELKESRGFCTVIEPESFFDSVLRVEGIKEFLHLDRSGIPESPIEVISSGIPRIASRTSKRRKAPQR